jgi:hypothetical protein
MFCGRELYQAAPGCLMVEQLVREAVPIIWNYCQCQAFRLNINGRIVYMLNDSLTPDNINKYQEYAIVVPTAEVVEDGVTRVSGVQIDSLTVNFYGATQSVIAEALNHYGDPAHDEARGRVVFSLEAPGKHKCLYCE